MSFDSSRFTFNPWNDFSGVVMEQGRVQLDSDWNEWLAELARRIRAGTYDTLGPAVYPSTTPNAFLITPTAGSISIGVGRMYVDGLLAENHGLPAPQSGGWIPPSVAPSSTQPAWDAAMDELVGQNPIDYTQQPYFPNASVVAPFPTSGGPFLVYLDVWLREITFLEDPDLMEKAVSVDTTGRVQVAWQVKLLDVSSVTGGVTCTTNDSDIPPWESLIQPSAGRLTTGVVQSSPSGPCCLAPNTGYTGLENQLYRVEIHQPGTSASSPVGTFKWSRNNAAVSTAVTGISQSGTLLTVQSTHKDSVLRFSANDWVEITDDWLELTGQHGELHQISQVTDAANTIQLSTAVSSASFPVNASNQTDPTRHTRLILWNQSGKVYESDGTTVWTDLGASGSTGDINIPPPGTSLILEDGVTVSFDLNPSSGQFNVGDYWTFAARTVDGTVECLVEAPPAGIHHHYARLAMLTSSGASDCRLPWPPSGGGGGCDCGSCVTAQSHNDGSWTIQDGIGAVQTQGGGKVCLGPGSYNITQTITIAGGAQPAQNIVICGHGLPILLPATGFSGGNIMTIEGASDIEIDGIAFAGGAGVSPPAGEVSFSPAGVSIGPGGLLVEQSAYVQVENCVFGQPTDTAQLSPAIALAGIVANCAIRKSLFTNVQVGIALGSTDYNFVTQLEITDNQLHCTDGAVYLSNAEMLFVSEVRFADNFVQSCSGFVLVGQGLDVTVEDNTFAIAAATLPEGGAPNVGVMCNISQPRIVNNQISGVAGTLTVSSSSTQGALSAGNYTWVVTALDASHREILITAPATLAATANSSAQLEWAPAQGAVSYNVYRTGVNGTALLLDANVPTTSGTTVTYTDSLADGSLTTALPSMPTEGIVLGSPSARSSSIYGAQVIGNRISGLTDMGISVPLRTVLLETILSQNQLLNLGGNGIVMAGSAMDLDITENSIVLAGQLPGLAGIIGIELRAVIDLNLSENKIESLGPAAVAGQQARAGILVVLAADARIAGNRVIDIGPTTTTSMGVAAASVGRLDVADNEIQRASVLPTQIDQSYWLALLVAGENISVQGNLLESFGGNGTAPGTVDVIALQSCVFSNNQCLLDDLAGSAQNLVAAVTGSSVIAMGNLAQGPRGFSDTGAPLPSLALTVTGNPKLPPVTVVGNITGSGITVNGNTLQAPWAPLNVEIL